MEMWSTTLLREAGPDFSGPIRGPQDLGKIMAHLTSGSPSEMMYCFVLNSHHDIVAFHLISSGIMDATLSHPREVFRAAILGNGAAIICAHNHPSGYLSFSREDEHIAKKLREAGEVLGIPLLDFVVTNHRGEFASMAGEGKL